MSGGPAAASLTRTFGVELIQALHRLLNLREDERRAGLPCFLFLHDQQPFVSLPTRRKHVSSHESAISSQTTPPIAAVWAPTSPRSSSQPSSSVSCTWMR